MQDIIPPLFSGDYNLNATEVRIILCIWYNNDYGKKRGAELSLRDLSKEVKACKRQIQICLNSLIDRNIVLIVEEYSSKERYSRWLMINTVDKWIK